jgi:conjugal transfer pilus assembly protein TraD
LSPKEEKKDPMWEFLTLVFWAGFLIALLYLLPVFLLSIPFIFLYFWAFKDREDSLEFQFRVLRMVGFYVGSYLIGWLFVGHPWQEDRFEGLFFQHGMELLASWAIWISESVPKLFFNLTSVHSIVRYFRWILFAASTVGLILSVLLILNQWNLFGNRIYRFISSFFMRYLNYGDDLSDQVKDKWIKITLDLFLLSISIAIVIFLFKASPVGVLTRTGSVLGTIIFLMNVFSFVRRKPNLANNKDFIPIGLIDDVDQAYLTPEQMNHHIHIVGSSGYGKSTLLSHIIEHHIHFGMGIIFIDFKPDRELTQLLVQESIKNKRAKDFWLFSPDTYPSLHYNPFKYGNPTELKDKVISSFTWSDPYYQKIAEEVVLKLFMGLVHLRETKQFEFDLHDLYNLVTSPEHLSQLIEKIEHESIKQSLLQLKYQFSDKNLTRDLQGLRSDLGNIIHSEFGPLLAKSAKGIDFYKAIMESKIVYIRLNAQKYENTAGHIGKMILQDLKNVSAKLIESVPKSQRQYASIIVDEFADLATDSFASFIGKARGSKLGIIVAHQEMEDLNKNSKTLLQQITANTSTKICFLQQTPSSADYIASIMGTVTTEKMTEATEDSLFGHTKTGDGSIREVEEYIIHPNDIKRMKRFEAFVIGKYPHSFYSKINIFKPIALKITHEQVVKELNRQYRNEFPAPKFIQQEISKTHVPIKENIDDLF